MIDIVIIVFVIIEMLNIMTLYFFPGSKYGNGIGVFNAYKISQDDEIMKPFVSYLINWVAGTKLIFVALGIGIVLFGDHTLKLYTSIAFVLSILTFYFRLYPIIRKLDVANQITPKNYSKGLNIMIASMIIMFMIAFIVEYIG